MNISDSEDGSELLVRNREYEPVNVSDFVIEMNIHLTDDFFISDKAQMVQMKPRPVFAGQSFREAFAHENTRRKNKIEFMTNLTVPSPGQRGDVQNKIYKTASTPRTTDTAYCILMFTRRSLLSASACK